MKKTILFLVNLMLSISAHAIDFYGVDKPSSSRIIKKHEKEISQIERMLRREIVGNNLDKISNKEMEKIGKIKRHLLAEIKKENAYLFVDLQTVFYPENKTIYSTIEIIDKDNPGRMTFVDSIPVIKNNKKKIKHKPDLIDEMIKYEAIGVKMILSHKMALYSSCPVYHCTSGFEDPRLKSYLSLFNAGAIKEKTLILDTLNDDKDPDRRAAAAFLVAHFNNPHEIISVLSAHVDDTDSGVRNNVMRVIGGTMEKSKLKDINVRPFLKALDSPYVTDRNKALWVLSESLGHRSSDSFILNHGGGKLLALLRLKQPNNHDLAYFILRKLSGKDFGSTNVAAWEKWVSSAQHQVV